MSEKVGQDRTSFRSPIRSISELRTNFDNFSACNRVPRLFGCSKNMHKHKLTVNTQHYGYKNVTCNEPKMSNLRNRRFLLLNNALWSKIALRIQIRIQNCTQILIFSEKLRNIAINDPGPYIYIYIYIDIQILRHTYIDIYIYIYIC